MMLPKADSSFNWGNLWADLLKGAGRGLLVHDGSRAAQAALAGLEVFDAAQERRREPDQQESGDDPNQDALLKLRSTMSPEEWAAFLRLPPADRDAWAEEWAEGPGDSAPLPHAGRPISINPLNGWHLQSALPLGSDGRLNLPTYRR